MLCVYSAEGSAERYSLQMLENLEVSPSDDSSTLKSEKVSRQKGSKGKKGNGEDDEDTLI